MFIAELIAIPARLPAKFVGVGDLGLEPAAVAVVRHFMRRKTPLKVPAGLAASTMARKNVIIRRAVGHPQADYLLVDRLGTLGVLTLEQSFLPPGGKRVEYEIAFNQAWRDVLTGSGRKPGPPALAVVKHLLENKELLVPFDLNIPNTPLKNRVIRETVGHRDADWSTIASLENLGVIEVSSINAELKIPERNTKLDFRIVLAPAWRMVFTSRGLQGGKQQPNLPARR